MRKGIIILSFVLLVLISSGCITNTKELAKIDELTTQLEEKDSQITDLSNQLETKNKKISEVEEKNSELSSQIVTKNEELAKQSNDLREKDDEVSDLIASKTKLEERINQLNYNLSQEQQINAEFANFLKEYTIALTNIHTANTYFEMANVNLEYAVDYTSTEGYYISTAQTYFLNGKAFANDAKELLLKAKNKLHTIKDDAPNSFFKEDVLNRIKQVDAFLSVVESEYLLLEYREQEINEINYGTEAKALEYYNKYYDQVPIANSYIKELSDIQNIIDLNWDQDWYPTYQGPTESETKYL